MLIITVQISRSICLNSRDVQFLDKILYIEHCSNFFGGDSKRIAHFLPIEETIYNKIQLDK